MIKACPSDVLPPAGVSASLMAPSPPQTALSTGKQVSKYMSLWGKIYASRHNTNTQTHDNKWQRYIVLLTFLVTDKKCLFDSQFENTVHPSGEMAVAAGGSCSQCIHNQKAEGNTTGAQLSCSFLFSLEP